MQEKTGIRKNAGKIFGAKEEFQKPEILVLNIFCQKFFKIYSEERSGEKIVARKKFTCQLKKNF